MIPITVNAKNVTFVADLVERGWWRCPCGALAMNAPKETKCRVCGQKRPNLTVSASEGAAAPMTGAAAKPPSGGTKARALPQAVRMTKPEREYGMRLEAMKRKGQIVDYRFQGLSLAWGADPETGILMRYKCDYVVFRDSWQRIAIIEVKGCHIFEKDIIRFKGCRAEWPMFQFEMHQLTGGQWHQVL